MQANPHPSHAEMNPGESFLERPGKQLFDVLFVSGISARAHETIGDLLIRQKIMKGRVGLDSWDDASRLARERLHQLPEKSWPRFQDSLQGNRSRAFVQFFDQLRRRNLCVQRR